MYFFLVKFERIVSKWDRLGVGWGGVGWGGKFQSNQVIEKKVYEDA